MKINNNYKINYHPVGSDDNEYKCITINDFFSDTNEIVTKDSIENLDYTDIQLSPFPLGKRSKIRINDDFLKDLLKDEFDFEYSRLDAELIYTRKTDVDSYESNMHHDIGEEIENAKRSDDPKYLDKFFGKFINNSPARPMFDVEPNFKAICMLSNFEDIWLEQNLVPFLEFFSVKKTLSYDEFYLYENELNGEQRQPLLWNESLFDFYKSSLGKQYPVTFPSIDDNWDTSFKAFSFNLELLIPYEFNKISIFPSNSFHLLTINKRYIDPDLLLEIKFYK